MSAGTVLTNGPKANRRTGPLKRRTLLPRRFDSTISHVDKGARRRFRRFSVVNLARIDESLGVAPQTS
jgi:hypothetical protein